MFIRSVDVGYGNVKYVRRQNGGFVPGHFPSIAPPHQGSDFGGDALSKKNVIRVMVDQSEYLVGPDAGLSLKNGNGRMLHQDYIERDGYMALVRGALAFIQEPRIDLLVTGLPVDFYSQHRERLVERLTGRHDYPDGSSIEVASTWVLPQPVGGFLNYATVNKNYTSLRETNVLVVDVGFYSVDWLVCRGLKAIDERSGSVDVGMSRFLDALARLVGDDFGEPFNDINRLDIALNNRNQLDW